MLTKGVLLGVCLMMSTDDDIVLYMYYLCALARVQLHHQPVDHQQLSPSLRSIFSQIRIHNTAVVCGMSVQCATWS